MSRLLETIKLFNKQLCNLEYHQKRFNKARKDLFGLSDELDLSSLIKIPTSISNSLFKVRIIYSDVIHDIEFHPYGMRAINSLQIVNGDGIDYAYKYEDRSSFQKLLCKCTADDILIVKNGLITDSSYSNVAFLEKGKFYVPSSYLLNGTKRQKLLAENVVTEKNITLDSIFDYEKIFLINSMIDIHDQISIPINQIKGTESL